jgi:hypothetical protein
MNPYINPAMQSQDTSGLNPVYQNMAAQQQYQNQVIAQGNQLAQQAGQTTGGGMNPLAMAAALRKDKQTDPNAQNAKDASMSSWGAYNPYTQYQTSQNYGTDPYSQQSLMLTSQDMGMK